MNKNKIIDLDAGVMLSVGRVTCYLTIRSLDSTMSFIVKDYFCKYKLFKFLKILTAKVLKMERRWCNAQF